MNIDIEKTRVANLRKYLFGILDVILNDKKYQINANMLSNDINNYSVDKIPTAGAVENWITGLEIHKDIYLFRSRMRYSPDVLTNLNNVGFFESIIFSNNKKGILPNIKGIETIQCLNCGSMEDADTNTCEFAIQLQITYKEGIN